MSTFRTVGISVTVLFFVSTLTPLWNVLGTYLSIEPSIHQASAIVVLGAGMSGPELSDESLRRVTHGIELFKQGLAPLLVLSGPVTPESRGHAEADVRKEMALRLDVPATNIMTMADVSTTRDEAIRSAARLTQGQPILLVTGSTHMRRAMRVFEHEGVLVFPAPSDDWPRYAEGAESRILLLRQVLEQAGGLLYYKLFGYI